MSMNSSVVNRIGVAGILMMLATATAQAGPIFDEPPGGDAGSSKDTATDVKGDNGGQVGTVRGSLTGTSSLAGLSDWQDVYRIYIENPNEFRAETYFLDGNDALRDPMLFLFDEHGKGVIANNNVHGDSTQSKLVNDDGNGGQYFSEAGIYYLAITSAMSEATVDIQSDWVPLFEMGQPGNDTGIVQPRSDWAGLLWSDGWTDVTDFENSGVYEIGLAGVGSVPAPGAIALLALGFRGRRRR